MSQEEVARGGPKRNCERSFSKEVEKGCHKRRSEEEVVKGGRERMSRKEVMRGAREGWQALFSFSRCMIGRAVGHPVPKATQNLQSGHRKHVVILLFLFDLSPLVLLLQLLLDLVASLTTLLPHDL